MNLRRSHSKDLDTSKVPLRTGPTLYSDGPTPHLRKLVNSFLSVDSHQSPERWLTSKSKVKREGQTAASGVDFVSM